MVKRSEVRVRVRKLLVEGRWRDEDGVEQLRQVAACCLV